MKAPRLTWLWGCSRSVITGACGRCSACSRRWAGPAGRGLARVRELVRAVGHGQTLTVFLITDGQDLGTGLEQQITRFPDRCVHLILVDPSGDCFGQEDAWRALYWASWSRLASLSDPRQVARETGAIFARSLGLRLRDSTLV